jgi:hypothetical protein
MDWEKWTPDLDRNQSRMVVEKALQTLTPVQHCMVTKALWAAVVGANIVLLEDLWFLATPLQECEACLRALGLWENRR